MSCQFQLSVSRCVDVSVFFLNETFEQWRQKKKRKNLCTARKTWLDFTFFKNLAFHNLLRWVWSFNRPFLDVLMSLCSFWTLFITYSDEFEVSIVRFSMCWCLCVLSERWQKKKTCVRHRRLHFTFSGKLTTPQCHVAQNSFRRGPCDQELPHEAHQSDAGAEGCASLGVDRHTHPEQARRPVVHFTLPEAGAVWRKSLVELHSPGPHPARGRGGPEVGSDLLPAVRCMFLESEGGRELSGTNWSGLRRVRPRLCECRWCTFSALVVFSSSALSYPHGLRTSLFPFNNSSWFFF